MVDKIDNSLKLVPIRNFTPVDKRIGSLEQDIKEILSRIEILKNLINDIQRSLIQEIVKVKVTLIKENLLVVTTVSNITHRISYLEDKVDKILIQLVQLNHTLKPMVRF